MAKGSSASGGRFLNKELPAFAFFLLLSFVLWYLNELGKELEGTINYPVRYINQPKGRVITGELPRKLEMDLRGPGYSILKMKLSGSRAPVVIDFSKMPVKRLPGPGAGHCLVTSGLTENFSRQLHADFEIISIKPDTLFFSYDRVVTRMMAVIPDVRVETYGQRHAVVVSVPDSIAVTGPEHLLDTLQGIQTARRNYSRTEGSFTRKIPIICPDYLQCNQKRVTIEVTVLSKPEARVRRRDDRGSLN